MKKYAYSIGVAVMAALLFASCQKSGSHQETAAADTVAAAAPVDSSFNMLTAAEKAAGWELLFDGKTFDGWKRYNHDTIGGLWTIQEGVIVCDGKGLTEGTHDGGGSLTSIRKFGNFELSVDWKVSPGGNSGIIYHAQEGKKYKNDFETGPEYQIIDDAGWKGKLHDEQKVGSNYDMFAAPLDTKKVMPVGEWNNARIVYNNGHVEQYLNGMKVVEFDEDSPDFKARYKKSKWTGYPDWNKSKVGSFGLQDHGAPVYFKNIKVRAL